MPLSDVNGFVNRRSPVQSWAPAQKRNENAEVYHGKALPEQAVFS